MNESVNRQAEIYIDYKKKTVLINPLHKLSFSKGFWIMMVVFLLDLRTMVIMFIPFIFISYFYHGLVESHYPVAPIVMGIFFFVSWFFIALLFTTYALYGKYGDAFYAKWNVNNERKIHVNVFRHKDFVFIPTKFHNVVLKYDLDDSVAKYLKSINVIKLHNDLRRKHFVNNWGIAFSFSKIPRGEMRLRVQ